jgi:hypothetical protein
MKYEPYLHAYLFILEFKGVYSGNDKKFIGVYHSEWPLRLISLITPPFYLQPFNYRKVKH